MRSHRSKFDKATREAGIARADGDCEFCGQEFAGRTPEFHHWPVPAALGGPATLDNLKVICQPCHRLATRKETIPMVTKPKRIEAKRTGTKAKGPPMPGSRKSAWKKRMDGTVVRR